MPVGEDERDRERPDVEGRPERDAQDARGVVARKERPVGAPGARVRLQAGHHRDRHRPDEENPADRVPRAAPEDDESDGGRREETDREQDRRPDGNVLVGAESVEEPRRGRAGPGSGRRPQMRRRHECASCGDPPTGGRPWRQCCHRDHPLTGAARRDRGAGPGARPRHAEAPVRSRRPASRRSHPHGSAAVALIVRLPSRPAARCAPGRCAARLRPASIRSPATGRLRRDAPMPGTAILRSR